jgi:cell shape-determining protein MreC
MRTVTDSLYMPPPDPDPYLRSKNSDLEAGNARYHEMEAENKRLKDLCSFQAEKISELAATMTTLAKVLGRKGEHV